MNNEINAAGTSPTSVHHQSCCDTSVVNLSGVSSAATSLRSSVQKSKKSRNILFVVVTLIGRLYLCLLASLALLPLLIVSYLFLRLLQFIRHGDDYYTVTQIKLFIRLLVYLSIAMVNLNNGLLMLAYKHSLKSSTSALVRALFSVPSWLYFSMFGICSFTYALPSIVSLITRLFPLKDHLESELLVREGVVEIIDCLLFWWVQSEIIKYVPAFKHHKILGLHTHIWIMVSLFVIIGYNVITLTIRVILWRLRVIVDNLTPGSDTESPRFILVEKFLHRNYLMYCANGMKHNMSFILASLMLLLTWVLFFGSHLDKTSQAKSVLEFGTWTFISLLICSILWLIKTCVLLSWESIVVYNRFRREILVGGKQLFFLGIIGRHSHDIFNLLYADKQKKGELSSWIQLSNYMKAILSGKSPDVGGEQIIQLIRRLLTSDFLQLMGCGDFRGSKSDVVDEQVTQINNVRNREDDNGGDHKELKVMKLSSKVKKRLTDELLMEDGHIPTIYRIQRIGKYLLNARKTLLKEDYISDILLHMETRSEDGILDQKNLKRFNELVGYNANATGEAQQLCTVCGLQQARREWMERAGDNCLFLANTLSSAKEAADCLNKIISWLIIAATFITWLFLTGLATTKLFVLIASPVLAATFIFGDTCKTLFQGIIFTYVVKPFDVGDLCVIDNIMMEVRTIGVWKTSFSKVSTQEEIIYTNSELFNKNIINHRTGFDWNDSIELDVASLNKEVIPQLQEEINNYLASAQKFKPGHNCVALMITEDKIKIAISFRHNNLNPDERNYSKCHKTKLEQRSELIHHVYYLVEQKKNP